MLSFAKKNNSNHGSGIWCGLCSGLGDGEIELSYFVSCRTQEKAEIAVRELMEESGLPQISFTAAPSLELSDLDSVRAFVAKFDHKLDTLVLNAGL